MKPLSRRVLLRGMLRGAAISLALPPLEAMLDRTGRAYACGGAIPRRFGLFYWGNGNIPDRWTPVKVGAEWELSEQLSPLLAVKDLVTVVSGLSVKFVNDKPHTSGATGILTGSPLVPVGSDVTFSTPTIDQVIADYIGNDTVWKSIQTAAAPCNGTSYNGPSSRNPPEADPYALFERLFGSSFREPGSTGPIDPTLGLRQSVLDAVMEDTARLRGRVGAADKLRLDQHLDGIRELETRLAKLQEDPPALDACVRPPELTADYADVEGRPQITARSRAMCDMLAMAMACDQTRVFAHFMDDQVGDTLFPGATAGHHQLTHDEAVPQNQVNSIVMQCVEEFAYLVGKLASVEEGEGTLLDNCAIMACSEVSEGRTHSVDEMPLLIAGSACGALKTGLHYRSYSQENVSKALLTLIRAMDVPVTEFGVDEGHTDETLTEIET